MAGGEVGAAAARGRNTSTTPVQNRGLACKIHPALTYGKRITPTRIP